MKKIEKKFRSALQAARPIACSTVEEAISLLGISQETYVDYENSDNFTIKIEPTGIMSETNGCPTNEVLLTIEWE